MELQLIEETLSAFEKYLRKLLELSQTTVFSVSPQMKSRLGSSYFRWPLF